MGWLARLPQRHIRVGVVAGAIEDPLSRLRFLRAAAARASWMRRCRRWVVGAVLLPTPLIPFLMRITVRKPEPTRQRLVPLPAAPAREAGLPAPVWQIEASGDSEVYSNGLRIDTHFTIANRPRSYLAFARTAPAIRSIRRTAPAGIVYHTSESCLAPLEADETPVIKRLGESLLEYVRRNRAYNYLIDRFGRVYRVVAESDTAWHAGHSVWADADSLYVDLNASFLGVSFEAQSNSGHAGNLVSPAQIRAATMLTEMLRSRYRIPAEDCVTHAQVSVNPSNMLIGYHTDWAAGFPFEALSLPDNYQRALPSLWAFGFDYEPAWLQTERGMSNGIERGEIEILREAAAAGMRPEVYRRTLQKRYRERLGQVRLTPAPAPSADSRSRASPPAPLPPSPAAHKRTRPHGPSGK
jgi:hypothetical protein